MIFKNWWVQSAIRLTTQELSNLFQTLPEATDLSSSRKLSVEAERELALEEKKLQGAHVDCLDPELDCILVYFTFSSLSYRNSHADRIS